MIEYVLYLSPLLALLLGILCITFRDDTSTNISYSFKTARTFLFISFFLEIVFYNKSLIANVTQGSPFTLLFESSLYICAFIVLYLSKKWFTSMNVAGHWFCSCILMSVLYGCLLVESYNLLLTVLMCVLLMLNNFTLIKLFQKKKDSSFNVKIYMIMMFLSWLLSGFSLIVFYTYSGDLSYSALLPYIDVNQQDLLIFAAVAALVCVFVFMFGLAPLHFWFAEVLANTILPVITYFLLVPIVACFGCFIQLNLHMLAAYQDELLFFYKIVALLSVGIGAIGACSAQNIRKTFAYVSVYHLGLILLTLFHFTPKTVDASFVYLFSYLLAITGICTTLFGLKIKGEYLMTLPELSGAAYKKPYIAAMMAVFIFSLSGLPPFLGFMGQFSVLSRLAAYRLYELGFVLLMSIILTFAYIQIIYTMFKDNKIPFDRADKGIYAAMLINAAVMLFIVVNPQYLVEDFVLMIETVFK